MRPTVKRLTLWIGAVAIASVYLFTRFLFLDSDAPPFTGTEYATIDEFYYSIKAIYWNKAHLYDQYQGIINHFPFNWVSNSLTFITLKLGGLNLFGLRASAVITGAVVIVATWRIVAPRFGTPFALFCAAYLVFDFHFLLATRIVEPTIYRSAITMVVLLICRLYLESAEKRGERKGGDLHVLASSALVSGLYFFEYPTTFFVVIAWVVTLLIGGPPSVAAIVRRLALFALATAAMLAAYLGVVVASGMYLDAPLLFSLNYSGRLVFVGGDLLNRLVSNLGALLYTQFLLNVPLFRYLFLVTGIVFGITAVMRWASGIREGRALTIGTKFDLVLAVALGGAVAQIVLDNSYSLRKPILLLPLLLIGLCYCINELRDRLPARTSAVTTGVVLASLLSYSAVIHTPIAYRTIFASPQFNLKEASLAMQKYNGRYFIDGLSWVYSLYNEILPVGNSYYYTMPDLGPTAEQYKLMFKSGGPTEPALALLSVDQYEEQSIVREQFEPLEFINCSDEDRYYPVYIFKRAGVLVENAESSSNAARPPIGGPVELPRPAANCLYHSEPPN